MVQVDLVILESNGRDCTYFGYSCFDTVCHSSCVDPKNYSEELGKQYAMEEVVNSLWGHLGFVLQWAKYGLNVKPKENE